MAPSEQERATAWVTPALVMANTNAVSRQPEETTSKLPSQNQFQPFRLGFANFLAKMGKYLETKAFKCVQEIPLHPGQNCPSNAWWERQERLTTIDNFPKNCWTVGGRAVPAAVAELPLALLYGSVQPSGDGVQDARILPNQPALATTQ